MREILEAYGPDQFAPVSWYTSAPYSIPEALERKSWYGVTGTPWAWFDGTDEVVGGYPSGSTFDDYDPIVAAHLVIPSPVEIDAVYRMNTTTAGTLYVDILATAAIPTTDNVVQCVIVEEDVGVEHEINLAREVLPEEPLTLTLPGQTMSFERPFALSAGWNLDNVSYIVFVQSEAAGKEVLQATWARNGRGIGVSPEDELHATGDPGGPFDPSSIVYTVENLGPETIEYSVFASETWITVTNETGTLTGHESAEVTVALSAEAETLGRGLYTAQLFFVNDTEHIGDTALNAYLQIGETGLVYGYAMDTDPGWTAEGLWAHGQPTGGGGQYGGPDPSSGFTGLYVCGYNLSGDYENGLQETHLTTTAIDCSHVSLTTLRFQRWLGVEQPTYDHAYIRVSTDGTRWDPVWENDSEIADSEWTQVSYDLSALADGQSTVYVRWTMGTTDALGRFCGWNIDDVEIWGIIGDDTGIEGGDVTSGAAILSNYPNPFNPSTTVAFEIPARTRVSLRVYDVAGRLVRVLEDAMVGPGTHAVDWDGRDDDGQTLPSGVYFCRLASGLTTETRAMVLLK
jgi:hypothetical protein